LLLAQTASAPRSVQPVSRDRASSPWSTLPAGKPRRRSPLSSMGCPPIRFRRLGSGGPAVRCPVTWGRPPESPAVGRLLSTHPASSRLLSAPSVRTRPSPPTQAGGRATVTTATGGGPGGWRVGDGSIDGRGGRDAGDAADVALVSGRSVAGSGRRVGCGPRRPRLTTERPGRPGRRPERPSRAALWARKQAVARGGCSRRVAAVLGWWATTVRGRRRA
jgi:hypothetical protein